ncbi:MAG: hypothetical protein AVDCRST_MAG51-1102, partial [uncultured Ramlibacter sp.]
MSRRHYQQPTTRAAAPAPAAAGHRLLLLAIALAGGFTVPAAQAQPAGATAIHGSAVLSQQGNKLVVTTQNGAGTSHSAINWQSFNVPGGTTTHFAQPGATSTSINRVVGPDPSSIFGTLSSNGRLVLVNPAGIAVGAGAVVDTAGFTASTLRMTDADALSGRLRFGDGTPGGPLRVDGQILARQGDIVLIGQKVETGAQAVIESPQGATILAAGQKVEVTGRGLEGIVFEVQAPSDQAVNLGTLKGDAVGVFAGTLKHSGLIQAQAVSTGGGKVVLKAVGDSLVDGSITASGANGVGGAIDVLGQRVGLMDCAALDASGALGGGKIRVGG